MPDLTDEQIRTGFEVVCPLYAKRLSELRAGSRRMRTDESLPHTYDDMAMGAEYAFTDGARFAERELKAQLKRMEMLRQGHRRLEVRYWTGHWWEPLTGASLDACLDALGDTGASTKDL